METGEFFEGPCVFYDVDPYEVDEEKYDEGEEGPLILKEYSEFASFNFPEQKEQFKAACVYAYCHHKELVNNYDLFDGKDYQSYKKYFNDTIHQIIEEGKSLDFNLDDWEMTIKEKRNWLSNYITKTALLPKI